MTTKRHLDDGREPAQAIVAAFGNQKSRLGQVVSARNRLPALHRPESDPSVSPRRDSCEPTGGESVNLEYRRAHKPFC
jgi:hypothetical protein